MKTKMTVIHHTRHTYHCIRLVSDL